MPQAKERDEPIGAGSLLQLKGIMFENFLHSFFNKFTEREKVVKICGFFSTLPQKTKQFPC